jgi:Tol biopolymer transport system component
MPSDRKVSGSGPEPRPSERLDGWKEIAFYLGKGVTTVRRWAREEDLPVRRLEHLKRGSVIAYREELDDWLRARAELPAPSTTSPPSGRRLAVLAGAGVLVVFLLLITARARIHHVPVHEIRVLTSDPGPENGGTLSPDGRYLAYARESGSIVIKSMEEESLVDIYAEQDGGMLVHPAWSPDGSYIAFSRTLDEKKWELMLVTPDGRTVRSLGPGGPALSWMPGSRSLLFAWRTPGAGDASAIFEIDIATGGRRQVSFPPPGSWGDIAAAASPDGRHLAIVRYLTFGKGDVYAAQIGRTELTKLTSSDTWVLGVDWSPDGRNLVFGGTYRNLDGLFLLPATGGAEPVRIAGTEGRSIYPRVRRKTNRSWTVTYDHEDWDSNIKAFDLGASEVRDVAVSTRMDEAPDLTPDGGSLVFTSSRSGLPNLWVCHGDCTAPRQITFFRETFAEMSPRWSPDARQIVFCRRAGSHDGILVADLDGRIRPLLKDSSSEFALPSWSRNGQWIYFASGRGGRSAIWRVNADGQKLQQVTSGGGAEARESPDGRDLYLLRDVIQGPLIRHSLSDGAESQVPGLSLVRRGFWTLAASSVYYFDFDRPPDRQWRIDLCRLDLSTGIRTVLLTRSDHRQILGSLTANGNGSTLLWAERSQKTADILAVEFPE